MHACTHMCLFSLNKTSFVLNAIYLFTVSCDLLATLSKTVYLYEVHKTEDWVEDLKMTDT